MRIQQILDIAFHRNGISGAPFHVILFDDSGEEASRKLAVVFEAAHHVAVLDLAKLAIGNIAFGQNSWRGDVFEPELRLVISECERRVESFHRASDCDGGQP
ncbi:MAG: hypothetical protein KDA96_22435 [Planctomycetaceae bacterium]|nr:hypothetical protein [Planctomycetaceae bacterium]